MKSVIFSPRHGLWSSSKGWINTLQSDTLLPFGIPMILNFRPKAKARLCCASKCIELNNESLRELFKLTINETAGRLPKALELLSNMDSYWFEVWNDNDSNNTRLVNFLREESPFDIAWDNTGKTGIMFPKKHALDFDGV